MSITSYFRWTPTKYEPTSARAAPTTAPGGRRSYSRTVDADALVCDIQHRFLAGCSLPRSRRTWSSENSWLGRRKATFSQFSYTSLLTCVPAATVALESKRSAPLNARPGATTAWNDVVCTMTRAFRLTTAKAESAHRTEHAKLKDVTMLCKNAWLSPPDSFALAETPRTYRLCEIRQGSTAKSMQGCCGTCLTAQIRPPSNKN